MGAGRFWRGRAGNGFGAFKARSAWGLAGSWGANSCSAQPRARGWIARRTALQRVAGVAFEDGLGDRRAVPEGEDLVGDRHELEWVPAVVRPYGGGQQGARDGAGAEQDPPFVWSEFQELQAGQPGDLQRVGERAGEGGEGPQLGQAG